MPRRCIARGQIHISKPDAHRNIEAMLEGRDWLAYFAGIARWNDFHKVIDRSDYPRLSRLYERPQEDPAVQFAHAVEDEREARSPGGFRGHVALGEALKLTA